MKSENLIKRIENIRKKDKNPILLVKFKTYNIQKRKEVVCYCCGVFSSIEDGLGGILWMKSACKGTRDKKHSVRMPMEVEVTKIISIRQLNVQDLINNTNRLARVINSIIQENSM